jgi:uncharacterized protein YggU (UPF0235/DUF167 family)
MSNRTFHLHDGKRGAALAVRVTPRATANKVTELMNDGTVKVHLAAAPVDDEINTELLKFLADVLGVSKSRLDIVAGLLGRDKLISVIDMDAESAHNRILAYLE